MFLFELLPGAEPWSGERPRRRWHRVGRRGVLLSDEGWRFTLEDHIPPQAPRRLVRLVLLARFVIVNCCGGPGGREDVGPSIPPASKMGRRRKIAHFDPFSMVRPCGSPPWDSSKSRFRIGSPVSDSPRSHCRIGSKPQDSAKLRFRIGSPPRDSPKSRFRIGSQVSDSPRSHCRIGSKPRDSAKSRFRIGSPAADSPMEGFRTGGQTGEAGSEPGLPGTFAGGPPPGAWLSGSAPRPGAGLRGCADGLSRQTKRRKGR